MKFANFATFPLVEPLTGNSGGPNRPSANRRSAFSMVELLVVMTLLSLIVLALMAVFNSTQQAFRAGVTQTDVLEGSRATVDLMTSDLRGLTPSDGTTNYWVDKNGFATSVPSGGPEFFGAVNFMALDNNNCGFSYNSYLPSLAYQPLVQSLPGSTLMRTNVLNYFFLLGRVNTRWTGVGYVVNSASSSPLYPLYRFYAETNIAASPYALFTDFTNAVYYAQWTNLSHVMNGVVHLTVRPFDAGGYRMTNTALVVSRSLNGQTNYHDNVWFTPYPYWGEVGCYFFSNAVPASVELELGVLEDRALERAGSLPFQSPAQLNYLAQQAGKIHLFRQRVTIPNVDPSAYQ
jgi:type II secretory pathway pseudopilin PulG